MINPEETITCKECGTENEQGVDFQSGTINGSCEDCGEEFEFDEYFG